MFNLYSAEKAQRITKEKKMIEEKESKIKENRKSTKKYFKKFRNNGRSY